MPIHRLAATLLALSLASGSVAADFPKSLPKDLWEILIPESNPVSEGISGRKGTRNAPTVLNSIFYEFQFWDGRADSLEEQAEGSMINPVEMASGAAV